MPPRSTTYMSLHPSEIRFSQDSICRNFQKGGRVNDLIDALQSGRTNIKSIPTISVVKHINNKYYSMDNRRLYVFRVLQKRGIIDTIKVRFVTSYNPDKFTTDNDGKSIQIRGDRTFRHVIDDDVSSAQNKRNIRINTTFDSMPNQQQNEVFNQRPKSTQRNVKAKAKTYQPSTAYCEEYERPHQFTYVPRVTNLPPSSPTILPSPPRRTPEQRYCPPPSPTILPSSSRRTPEQRYWPPSSPTMLPSSSRRTPEQRYWPPPSPTVLPSPPRRASEQSYSRGYSVVSGNPTRAAQPRGNVQRNYNVLTAVTVRPIVQDDEVYACCCCCKIS